MMKNNQEIWTAMIISNYAKKLNTSISKLSQKLLNDGRMKYLEEYYDTLHLLSNNDVIRELEDIVQHEVIA